MGKESIEIGKLFDECVTNGYNIHNVNGYELIYPDNINILTIDKKYVKLKTLSRHKTKKNLIELTIKSNNGFNKITVTTDHICMVYTKNHFFENTNAKNVNVGDMVSIYSEKDDTELIGTIDKIIDLGKTQEYVYDCEVDDDLHSFYANDILIHNSQFVNIQCITDYFKKEYNLPNVISDWKNEDKLKLWNYCSDFVENDINKFIQGHLKKWYHTNKYNVLKYELEYMTDVGLYESKKHYGVHKNMVEGPEIVDKIKYSGIELKKASIPKEVKVFLADIYSGVLTKNWNEQDFRNYVNDAYDKICKMDIEQLAFWRGYGTEREAEGFLQMKKGVTSISASCTYYNQLLEKLGIGSKYDSILIGDKVRFCYIDPNNKYGIKYIAFKDGQYPDEFRKIFKLDYPVMFDKLVLSPLKNFIKACGYSENIDPNNQNIISVDDL